MLPQIQVDSETMNLAPYFDRIGFRAAAKADLATLRALHLLHPLAIPFENLSTLLREPVPLGLDALIEKLILRRRGGYCFEQNSLFQHVLGEIGFEIQPLAARVVWSENPDHQNPRTHMALIATIDQERYLCDVGFGGATLTAPLLFEPGRIQQTPHESFRISVNGRDYQLDVRFGDRWRTAYQFDLQTQLPIDYEAMNHYVHSHPDSHFRTVLMAALAVEHGRLAMAQNEFTRYQDGKVAEKRTITAAAELERLLTDEFQIALPTHQALGSLLRRICLAEAE